MNEEIARENDYIKLQQIADLVAGRMQEIRDQAAQAAPELRARFHAECQKHGLTLEELCNGKKPRKPRSRNKGTD